MKNFCNIYIGLWCLYLLQGTLYETGSILSVSLLTIILAMSLFHFVQVLKWRGNPIYLTGLEVLVFMFIVYGIFLIITDGAYTKGISMHLNTYIYLKDYMCSLLPIFSCYFFSKKGLLTRESLQYWIPVFIVVAVFQYYNYEKTALEALISDRENTTNNAGYVFLSLIPCMFAYRKRFLQIIGIVICTLFILFSMKRGAVLVAGVVIILYFFQQMRTLGREKRFFFLLLMIVAGTLLYQYLNDSLFQNDFFNQRIEKTLEGDSSGRDDIYNTLWQKYADFNFIEQVFGKGADGTLKISSDYAHSDWLEILINQGMMGIIIFIFYWICFIRTTLSKRFSQASRDLLLVVFSLTLLKSVFSMSMNGNIIYLSAILGLALADGLQETNIEYRTK